MHRDGTAQIVADRRSNTVGSFFGPIPPPSLLANYDEVHPGLAERIVKMAEVQAEHRQGMEARSLDSRLFLAKAGIFTGLFVALAVLTTAAYIAYLGHPVSASILGVSDLVGLVAVFVTGQRAKDTKKTEDASRALSTTSQEPREKVSARTKRDGG